MIDCRKPNVLILDDWNGQAENSNAIDRLRQQPEIASIRVSKRRLAEAELHPLLAQADILIPIRERTAISADFLEWAPKLRLIAQTGTGVAHIDLDAAKLRGVEVRTTDGASSTAVAELCLAMVLALFRRIPIDHCEIQRGGWPDSVGRELRGSTVGLVGFGRNARTLATSLVALGATVRAWARTRPDPHEGVQFHNDLVDMLQHCDAVSLHLPLTSETEGFFERRFFNAMPVGSVLINTARGAVVDEDALHEMLESDRLAAAALDVFNSEPLALDSPFRSNPNVLLTPHIGWQTRETMERFLEGSCENILSFLRGEPDHRSDGA